MPLATAQRQYVYERPWMYPKQLGAIFCPERYAVVEASTKAGKTVACMAWIAEQAMKGRRGDNYYWVAPIYAQAAIAFRRLCDGLPRHLYEANDSKLTLSLPNGAVIWFKGADNPDSLFGDNVKAAVIDEASRCKEESWHAVRSTLTATNGPIRVIGNVNGRRNWAYRLARRAEQGHPDMRYSRITAFDAVEAGVLKRSEIEDARVQLPEHIFRQLYMAEPADDGSNPFGIDHIRACIMGKSSGEPVAWGIDLGMEVDWTVAIGLDNDGHVCRFGRWQHRPWPVTESHLAQMIGSTPALLDATGLGSPVYGHLVQHMPQLEPFVFTGRSKQELIDSLIIAIQQGQIGYPDGQIVSELETMEATFTRTGVQYQAMSGMHDDCVMALALAWRMWLARPREESVVETWDI